MKPITAIFRALRSLPRLFAFVLCCTIETRRMKRARKTRRENNQ